MESNGTKQDTGTPTPTRRTSFIPGTFVQRQEFGRDGRLYDVTYKPGKVWFIAHGLSAEQPEASELDLLEGMYGVAS